MRSDTQPAPRAVLVEEFGAPSSFRLVERDPGTPGPGEVRMRIHAAGISYVDVLIAEGAYQVKPDLPFVPGSDVSGVIEAVGEGVDIMVDCHARPSPRMGLRFAKALDCYGLYFFEEPCWPETIEDIASFTSICIT